MSLVRMMTCRRREIHRRSWLWDLAAAVESFVSAADQRPVVQHVQLMRTARQIVQLNAQLLPHSQGIKVLTDTEAGRPTPGQILPCSLRAAVLGPHSCQPAPVVLLQFLAHADDCHHLLKPCPASCRRGSMSQHLSNSTANPKVDWHALCLSKGHAHLSSTCHW